MEFSYPKYPFIWNYSDMFQIPDWSLTTNLNDINDNNLNNILLKYPNHQVIRTTQKIKSDDININFHTWYINKLNVFTSNDTMIHIKTNSKFKFKANVCGHIYDPNDLFENLYENSKKNLLIIKNINNLVNISTIYINTHSIKNIIRFSPKSNSEFKLKANITNGRFYIIVDTAIIVSDIEII